MPIKSVIVPAALAATLFHVPAVPQDNALPQYRLDLTLYDGANIVGKPSMVVDAWTANRIAIDNADGSHYHAAFTVEPRDEARLLFVSRFDVSSSAVGAVTAEPMLEVEAGKPVAIVMGRDADPNNAFRAEMTISRTRN